MVGLEMASGDLAKAAVQQMLERGVILNRTDETVLRFLPPFVIRNKHVDEVITKLDQVLTRNTKQVAGAAPRRSR